MSTPLIATPTPSTPPPQTPPVQPAVNFVAAPEAPVAVVPSTPAAKVPVSKDLETKLLKSFGITPKPVEKKEEPKPAEKPIEKPAAKADPKSKEKKEPKDGFDPDLPTPPKAKIDAGEIREIVRETVKGAMEATQSKAPKTPKPEEPVMPAEVIKKSELIDILDKEVPELKGLKAATTEFYKPGGLEEQYRKQWMADNPGKPFKKDSEEHDEWFAENDPLVKVQDDQWDDARDLRATKRATDIAQRTTQRAFDEQNQRQAVERSAGETRTALDEIAIDTISGLSPELAEKAKDPSKLQLNEEDPVAEHVLLQSINRYAPAVRGVIEIFGGVPYDPVNPTHKAVNDIGVELEDQLAKMPVKGALRGNLQFSKISDYSRMPASEQAKHWTIGKQDILNYVKILSKKQSTDLYNQLTKRKLGTKTEPGTTNGKPQKQEEPEETIASPSVGSTTPAPPAGGANGSANGSNGSRFVKSFLGR